MTTLDTLTFIGEHKSYVDTVLLLGCGIVEIPLNILAAAFINGSLAHTSAENENGLYFPKTDAAFFVVAVFVGALTRLYLCDILRLVSCS